MAYWIHRKMLDRCGYMLEQGEHFVSFGYKVNCLFTFRKTNSVTIIVPARSGSSNNNNNNDESNYDHTGFLQDQAEDDDEDYDPTHYINYNNSQYSIPYSSKTKRNSNINLHNSSSNNNNNNNDDNCDDNSRTSNIAEAVHRKRRTLY